MLQRSWIKFSSRHIHGKGCCLLRIQPGKYYLTHQVVAQELPEQDRDGMSLVELLEACRADDEQSRFRSKSEQEMKPINRVAITPVDVIENQQKRLARLQYRACHSLKEVASLPALGVGLRRGELWMFR